MLNIAINGFGRIGRAVLKIALTKKNLRVVAINDLGDPQNLAYLLKYDSVYGRFDKPIKISGKELVVAGKKIPIFAIPEPNKLPWKKLKVDVVLECTGFFTEKKDAEKHLKAGAKAVIISAATKSAEIPTVVRSVNEKIGKGHKIVANASCTTNCISPVMAVLEANFGIEKALLTTVHAMTASQGVVDSPDRKDWRRGRCTNLNIIPSTTGAAIATTLTVPSLKNKFDGIALRVPVACGSISDIVAVLKKNVTVDQVNNAFKRAAKMPLYRGVLEVSEDDLVSADIVGTTASAIVDLQYTRVVDGNLVKILAWYDNEWAYSNRLVEMAGFIFSK